MISLDVDRAVATAAAHFERGEFAAALEVYRAILVSRLHQPGLTTTAFDAAVIERVAISRPCLGNTTRLQIF